MAGLALPTAAAVTLMFISTGAAVATSTKTQSVAFNQNATAVTSAPPVAVDPAVIRARRAKAIERTLAVARAEAVARANRSALVAAGVARTTHRKNIAARAQQALNARVVKAQQAKQAQQAQAVQAMQAVAAQRAQTADANSAASAHGWQLPLSNPVKTSGFGYRWGRLHAGEDFAVPVGTNLVSMSTGTVDFAGQESGYGTIVKIRYWDGTISYYGHMSNISVNVGESVEPGQVIGQSGNTGHSTGPHLHLEIHPNGGAAIDPLPWLANRNIAP